MPAVDSSNNPIKDEDGNTIVLRDSRGGVFVGMKLVDEQSRLLSSLSLGVQQTFQTSKRTISVGLGAVVHPTKEFAEGIVEGASLPDNFNEITFEEGTEISWMIMLSFGI